MRIAMTADLHLTTREEDPDRFAALEDILRQCGELGVEGLIIAGDLFDRSRQNFADFEQSFKSARPPGLTVIVIPGNHDPDLKAGALAVEGLEVVSEPSLRPAEDDFNLLLVPYRVGTSMGEHLPPFRDRLKPGRWALVSHGDWSGGLHGADPNEPGVYMPLTRADLAGTEPAVVLLGHIHTPLDGPPVYYPGSPCPLDVNETGPRRFLVFDTETMEISVQRVDSPRLYFNETVVMLPVEDERAYLMAELKQRVQAWGLPDGWQDRVRLRLRITGYSADRSAVEAVAREVGAVFTFYEAGPDLSDLNHAFGEDRIHIARQVREWIGAQEFPEGAADPTAEDIALEALRVIWGA